MIAVLVGGFLATWYLLSQNKFIYYWDYGGYWTTSYTEMHNTFNDPASAPKRLYESIIASDYNLILPAIISLPLRVFGFTFSRYVLINYIIFFCPTYFILVALLTKLHNSNFKKRLSGKMFLITALLPLMFPALFLALLAGYIDIAALIPTSLVLLLSVDYDLTKGEKSTYRKSILISILLLVTFLFRRYFAFFVVGYIAAIGLYSLYIIFRNRKKKATFRKTLKNIAKNFCLLVGTMGAVLLIAFFGLVKRILSNDYSEQYAGYNMPLLEKTGVLIEYYGWFLVILGLSGIVIAFFIKKKYRKFAALMCAMAMITIFGFFRVQFMGTQHIYTISLQIFALAVIAVFCLLGSTKKFLSYLVILLLVFNSANFLFRFEFLGTSTIFSKRATIHRRDDIQDIKDMVAYIKGLQKEQIDLGNNDKVYVVASSGIINDDVIRSVNKPYETSSLDNLEAVSHLDLRDGFPVSFLDSSIIVTADPVQLHLAKGTQEVVRYLHEELTTEGSYINKHFDLKPEKFILDEEVTVSFYVKNSDFSQEDRQKIAAYFSDYYPGKEALFADRIINQ